MENRQRTAAINPYPGHAGFPSGDDARRGRSTQRNGAAAEWKRVALRQAWPAAVRMLNWMDAHRMNSPTCLRARRKNPSGVRRRSNNALWTYWSSPRAWGAGLQGGVSRRKRTGVCYSRLAAARLVGLIALEFSCRDSCWKLGAARFVAGNTCILKPSPLTPLTATASYEGSKKRACSGRCKSCAWRQRAGHRVIQ